MSVFWLSVLFFAIGTVEYFIDLWERLVSVRLKIFQTLCAATLNHYIDFIMYVSLFYILDEVVNKWHRGVHDYSSLVPFIFYVHGKIAGTVLGPFIYSKKKKKSDMEKAAKFVAKARVKSKKKQTKKQKKVEAAIKAATPEPMLDAVEVADMKEEIKNRAVEKVAEQISQKVEDAFNENN